MSGNVATVNTTSIQLVLVDDHAMFRQGLARVLEKEPGFKVTGQFASSAEALEALQENGATMVLLDVDLGPERAVDFVEEAKKRGFAGKILVVTAGVAPQQAVELVESGVAGIVHKHHSIEMLCGTIRQVAAGEVYLEKEYLTALYHSVDRTKTHERARLTERERAIVRFILQGLNNREISIRLKISEGAVKSSLRHLFDKLGARNRAQLVAVVLEGYRDQL